MVKPNSLQADERLRLLAEQAPDIIYRYEFEPVRGFSYVSPSCLAMTGYSAEEHYADPDLGYKLVHPEDADLLRAATSTGATELLLRWVRKDGSILWTEQRNVPILAEDGTLLAIEGIARDITRQKEAEDALQRANAELDERVKTLLFSLAHELRGPLFSVVSLAGMLTTAEEPSPSIKDVLQRIIAAGGKLDSVLSGLIRGEARNE